MYVRFHNNRLKASVCVNFVGYRYFKVLVTVSITKSLLKLKILKELKKKFHLWNIIVVNLMVINTVLTLSVGSYFVCNRERIYIRMGMWVEASRSSVIERLLIVRWVFGSILHGEPLRYFSLQPVLHDWCNKMLSCLLIGKSSPCGGSGFPLSLSEWSFTISLTPYNCK